MKYIPRIFLCASVFAAAVPFARLNADTLTYNNIENGSFYSEESWTNSAGRPAQPDENSDIVITGTDKTLKYTIDATTGMTIKSLTDSAVVTGDKVYGKNVVIKISNSTFTIKEDLTITGNHNYAPTTFESSKHGLGDLVIGGNINISPSTNNGAAETLLGNAYRLNSITVGGDINASANFRFHATTVKVNGKLNILSNTTNLFYGQSGWGEKDLSLSYSFGGISSVNAEGTVSNRTLAIGANNFSFKNSVGTISLTNSDTSKFKGSLDFLGDCEDITYNLVMDKSAKGTQYFENLEEKGYTFGKVTVNGGTLKYFSHSMQSDFEVNGGTLSAATIDNEVASLNVNSLAWSGGTLAFDIAADGSYDMINVFGELTKASVEGAEATRNITLGAVDGFDLAAWLDTNGGEKAFSIINYLSTDLTAADIVAKSLVKGVNIKSIEVNEDGIIVILTTAVPEPATIAAILGALALAVAAVRRRK